MRIMGFSNKWDKLNNGYFSTFRFPRKDRDWFDGEVVQIVYKPRTKNREPLGNAKIMAKEQVWVKPFVLSFGEKYPDATFLDYGDARADGFNSPAEMIEYMKKTYGHRLHCEPMNKLTLKWF